MHYRCCYLIPIIFGPCIIYVIAKIDEDFELEQTDHE